MEITKCVCLTEAGHAPHTLLLDLGFGFILFGCGDWDLRKKRVSPVMASRGQSRALVAGKGQASLSDHEFGCGHCYSSKTWTEPELSQVQRLLFCLGQ